MVTAMMAASPLGLVISEANMDGYGIVIALLLPLTAGMVVTQVNPYHALVIRGILGAVAALVYALMGAADVALTEALVGTMLSITLYAIAVRSSLSLRLGILAPVAEVPSPQWSQLLNRIRDVIRPFHMRLELVPYPTSEALAAALQAKDIHVLCREVALEANSTYVLKVRGRRVYHLLGALPSELAQLDWIDPAGATAITPSMEVTSP